MGGLIIDACALFNIENSQVKLDVLARLPRGFFIQGLVRFEAASIERRLEALIRAGIVTEFDGKTISASSVQAIAERYSIGIGEAECIVIAKEADLGILTDDRRGRRAAVREGVMIVKGTIGILCECVDFKIMTATEAQINLDAMRFAGGHLPSFDFERRVLIN